MAIFLPLLLGGLAASATSFVINDQLQSAAEKRANLAFQTLQEEQDRFKEEKTQKQGELTAKFGSEERESELQTAREGIGALLTETSRRGRDDSALTDTPTGNVSEQFINRRAGVQSDLDTRLDRKTANLGNVLAQGSANFQEKDFVRREGQALDTINSLQRGNLRANEDVVNAAAIVEDSLLADILGVAGPLLSTAGLFAPGAAPGLGASLGSGLTVDLAGTTLASGATIPALSGFAGAEGLGGALAGLSSPKRKNRFVPPSLGGA